MPIPALVSTPGAANANTFADLTFYKTYVSIRRPQPSFAVQAAANLIDTDLTIDLLASCEILSAGIIWTGEAATDEQALIAPRIGWYNRNNKAIANNVIPTDLMKAQCELAVQLHEDALSKTEGADVLADDDAAKFNVKNVKAGPVSVEFQAVADTLEAVSVRMRQQESQFNYLTVIPKAVRLLLVPSWYVESEMNRGFILEPLI